MRKTLLSYAAIFVLIVVYIPASAQKKDFTYEQLFKENTSVTKPLPAIRGWEDDDHYVEMQKGTDGKMALMSVDVKTGKAAPYTGTKEFNEMPMGRREGAQGPSASTVSVKDARNITLSPDGKWEAYTKNDNNLYATELATKKEIQFTNDGSESILNGYASWVYYEEILGRGSRYRAFWWGPDSKHISYMRFDQSMVPIFPIYVIDGQHGYLENQRYPKAGDKNPEVKIGIVSVDNPTTVWSDFNAKDDQYFGAPYWTPGGQFWVQWMNRGQDNLKIYNVDLANGSKTVIYDEKQPTWIDLDEGGRITFLPSGKAFLMKSDKDGWQNLYLYDMTGKLIDQVTTGNFWGTNIERIDEKDKLVYFRARKENSARFDFYKIGLDGKGLARLTFGDYSHDNINLSPNAKYFITTYSNVSTPPAMALVDTKGKLVRELGSSKGDDFDKYNLPKTELVRVKSGDGLFELPVLITYPVNFDPNKKYPVLVSIYGGPNAGTVYDRWRPVGGGFAGGMTQWWAQEGLVQVAIDNRSSGHFGKKGENYIFKQLGKWEIEDFMTAGKWLKQQSWVENKELCITGGSFGGYMTCMALTYGSSVFDYGYANSSVTDWQYYDTHYTERYMKTPQENPEGYKNTSVLTYANNYKGLLHIIHGTSDDNVHMQNTLAFISKLEDQKKHFEMMVFPGERHGIAGLKGLDNRTESYQFYYTYLLHKPMPAQFWEPSPSGQRGF